MWPCVYMLPRKNGVGYVRMCVRVCVFVDVYMGVCVCVCLCVGMFLCV